MSIRGANNPNKGYVGVNLAAELKAQLETAAFQHGRSLSEEIRWRLDQSFQPVLPPMTKTDMFEVIRQGIAAAMPAKDDVLKAIQDGVVEAFPYSGDVSDAVSKGVVDAFPYTEELSSAVFQATKLAMGKS